MGGSYTSETMDTISRDIVDNQLNELSSRRLSEVFTMPFMGGSCLQMQ